MLVAVCVASLLLVRRRLCTSEVRVVFVGCVICCLLVLCECCLCSVRVVSRTYSL